MRHVLSERLHQRVPCHVALVARKAVPGPLVVVPCGQLPHEGRQVPHMHQRHHLLASPEDGDALRGQMPAPGICDGPWRRLDNPHPVPRRLAVCQRRVAANQPKGPKGGEIPDQACLKSACSLSSPSPYGRPENNTYGDWPRTYPNKAPATR